MRQRIEAQPRRITSGAQPAARPMRISVLFWPMLVAFAMMVWGVVLRAPTAAYAGPPDQRSFNNYIFGYLGAYSDITSLYFRDQLWRHPIPYIDYYVEYPVGMGWLIWLIGFVNSGVMPYLLATAVVMLLSGCIVLWLGSYIEGANLWLLALSPTLPLYVVLNWDMFSVMLTVAALVLFQRNRDGWGTLLLTAAVWTKFFPIVLVPLVVFDRVLKRRWRDVFLIGGIFGLGSALINGPVAIVNTPAGWQIRDTWLHFFRFNQERGSEVNFWTFFAGWQLTLQQINTWSALLLVAGLGILIILMAYNRRINGQNRDVLLPVSLAAIAWFFFINKVYSPQYSLWLAVLLAFLAAPPTLAVIFAAVDLAYFAGSFIVLYLADTQNVASAWFFNQALLPVTVMREAVIFGIVLYACWRIISRPAALPT